MSVRIWFVRHGATQGNLERRYIGRTDEPLCTQGEEQMLRLRDALPGVDRLFVSPMLRTRQSAALVYPDISWTEEVRLRELDFGVFEGESAQNLQGNLQYEKWLESMCTGPIPGGENVVDFKKRCVDGFLSCVEQLPQETSCAFVVHGGVIMSILERLARPKRDYYSYHLPNGGYYQGVWENGILTLE